LLVHRAPSRRRPPARYCMRARTSRDLHFMRNTPRSAASTDLILNVS
jgi:hypothetical protein